MIIQKKTQYNKIRYIKCNIVTFICNLIIDNLDKWSVILLLVWNPLQMGNCSDNVQGNISTGFSRNFGKDKTNRRNVSLVLHP